MKKIQILTLSASTIQGRDRHGEKWIKRAKRYKWCNEERSGMQNGRMENVSLLFPQH
jgi:hypothetical protein